MTKTEIIDGNKIIGKFMGKKFKDPLNYMYDNSWDWLIPVWNKLIISIKSISLRGNMWFDNKVELLEEKFYMSIENNDIQHGQKIISESIKWYYNIKN